MQYKESHEFNASRTIRERTESAVRADLWSDLGAKTSTE